MKFLLLLLAAFPGLAQNKNFRVLAFYTAKNDAAHISFAHEANQWFPEMGRQYGFTYDSTSDWSRLNPSVLATVDVVIFLDTRPEDSAQRAAFRQYMDKGGAWMGFHFAAFALTPSDYPQNWDWYHKTFLGSDSYVSNTWRPTMAILKVDDTTHPATGGLGPVILAAPNEWYRWSGRLRKNPDIQVLLSVDQSSFPLGTGPKPHEIWHKGDYPVVWTNRKYKMIYFNMGHNDIDYEHGTNQALSSSFSSPTQNRLILNSLVWLGR